MSHGSLTRSSSYSTTRRSGCGLAQRPHGEPRHGCRRTEWFASSSTRTSVFSNLSRASTLNIDRHSDALKWTWGSKISVQLLVDALTANRDLFTGDVLDL